MSLNTGILNQGQIAGQLRGVMTKAGLDKPGGLVTEGVRRLCGFVSGFYHMNTDSFTKTVLDTEKAAKEAARLGTKAALQSKKFFGLTCLGSVIQLGLTAYSIISLLDTFRINWQKSANKTHSLVANEDISKMAWVTGITSVVGAVPIVSGALRIMSSTATTHANPFVSCLGMGSGLIGSALNLVHQGLFMIPKALGIIHPTIGKFFGSYKVVTQLGVLTYLGMYECFVKMVENKSSLGNWALFGKYLFRVNERGGGDQYGMNVFALRGVEKQKQEAQADREQESSRQPLSSRMIQSLQENIYHKGVLA